MQKKLAIAISQASSEGVKKINQDYHDAVVPTGHQLIHKGVVIALADGISSSDVSQVASRFSVERFIKDYYATPQTWSVQKSAKGILSNINASLHTKSRQSEHRYNKDRGYVSTFSSMIIKSNSAYIFHIGDLRIYRLREGKLTQLTTDHRLWVSQEKSYLSRALGMDSEVLIDYEKFSIEEKDSYLLASDGVYEFLKEEDIIKALSAAEIEDDAAQKLLSAALANGSDDNLTAQILRIEMMPQKDATELQEKVGQLQPAPLLEVNDTLDEYLILRELSANHRSHVYLAKDTFTQERVVIKVPSQDLREDRVYLERFMMEEWVARRIKNEHVLKSYPQERPRSYLYTVFEYIEGESLAQWMIDNPNPKIATVRAIIEQIAKGLQAFHRHEMLHQDIRPQNILIDKDGVIKIIDFGSTRVEGIEEINSLIRQEHMLGTLLYSAPEYFLAETGTPASDIYSLAAIAYEMLSSRLPYGTDVAKATTKKAQRKLKYNSIYTDEFDIPYWVDQTLKKALHPNPFYRYNLLSEFVYDLHHPNPKFLKESQPPLFERYPVAFWKGVSVVLFFLNIYLLSLLSS